MNIIMKIPSPLRRFTQDAAMVELEAIHVGEALEQLCLTYPEIKPHLLDEQGELRNFVNIFHNKVDIRQLQGLDTLLHEDCELRIVPAIAGGSELATEDFYTSLSPDELSRYSRHILLPEIGVAGQERLKQASVLIVGAGGLGCPVSLYLAAAGVGRLGIIDGDVVDESNLQRQILYTVADVGVAKVDCAQDRLKQLNPYIKIDSYRQLLTKENALTIIGDYDLVIDGTDNFPTRYLVNDACVLLSKPNVYGSIFRFDGQATVFNYQGGPCYRCLYPEPPPPGLVPSCAEGGVLGVLPAIIASIQATEAIKMITGIGQSLSKRLMLYDALKLEFTTLAIQQNPDCPICGEQPTISALVDYQQLCGLAAGSEPILYQQISPQQLQQLLTDDDDVILIDVRESYERAICCIAGSRHIVMADVEQLMAQFNLDQPLVFHCKMGGRSAKVCQQFIAKGYINISNLTGGILAWTDQIDPSLTKY
jgi:adenylyltransferase/sulfurtransferase